MNQPDALLAALRAARPDPDYDPRPDSPQAREILARVTAPAHGPERLRAQSHLTRRLVLAGIPAIAGAAAVGAVVEANSGTSGPAKPSAPRAAGPVPSAASVRTGVLDALDRSGGDILLMTQTGSPLTRGTTEQIWIYPMLPKRGQEVRRRYVNSRGGSTTTDDEWSYIQPGPTEWAGAELVTVNYGSRTWFRGKTRMDVLLLAPGNYFAPSAIRADIAIGSFKVAGTTMLRGIRVVELTLALSGGLVFTLYVHATTYEPVEYVVSQRRPDGQWDQILTEFQVLPATQVNLAQLTTPIPAGFTRTKEAPSSLSSLPWTQ